MSEKELLEQILEQLKEINNKISTPVIHTYTYTPGKVTCEEFQAKINV